MSVRYVCDVCDVAALERGTYGVPAGWYFRVCEDAVWSDWRLSAGPMHQYQYSVVQHSCRRCSDRARRDSQMERLISALEAFNGVDHT